MADTPSCGTCKWWGPRYLGVGTCQREGRMHAKFWVNGKESELFTISSFGCSEHEKTPEQPKEIL